jgi:hypothetical protein
MMLCVDINLANLGVDLCLRTKVSDYHLNEKDQILKTFYKKEVVNTIIFQKHNLKTSF